MRYLFICLLIGLNAGCVDYRAAPIEPRRSAEAFAARRLDDPRLRERIARYLPQAAWPPQEWDRAQLLAVAWAQNPALAVARAKVQSVLAHQITAAETPNPDVTLQSEYAMHDVHPWLYGVGFGWLLRSRERLRLDGELARLDTVDARMELMDQAWAVRNGLATAMSQWEGARRRLMLLERLEAAQDRMLEFERRRVESGEDAPGELLLDQRQRIDIELQVSEQRTAVDAARGAAAKALGLPPQALEGMVLVWPEWGDPPVLTEEQLRVPREQALLARADLGVAIGEYAMAETKLKLAVARQYPQLVLQPGYYWDHGIAKFPFDVAFTLPVNRNRGELAEARAGRDLAGERMLALQAAIFGEIADAESAERIARVSAASAERQLAAARRQEQQAELGLRVGAADTLEQIGAQIVATRAELDLVQMRAQLQGARNLLEDVLHAPLSGPELALPESFTVDAAGPGS